MAIPPGDRRDQVQKAMHEAEPQHVKEKEGSGFGRAFTKFVSGPIARAWSHFTVGEKSETQELKIKATPLRDDDVIQSGPGEGMTVAEWKKVSLLMDKERQGEAPAKITQRELAELMEENTKLKDRIEDLERSLELVDTESEVELTEETRSSTEEAKTPREVLLENLLRELMLEMPVQARKPFNYAPEHIGQLFSEEVVSKAVSEPQSWTERKIVETDGKKSTIFYATDVGKKAVELLDRLGLMKKEASAGGIIYHAQARPTGDQAAKDYLTRLLLNWLLEQKGLVIDPEKAEGFLDLSQVENKLSTYLTKPARADWKPVADELGLPDRDELLSVILSLARSTTLEKAQAHAEELFDNPEDRRQLGKLARDETLQTTCDAIISRSDEDKMKQTEYYKEQKAQARKLLERQALIQSVLTGGSPGISTTDAPPPPPPPK